MTLSKSEKSNLLIIARQAISAKLLCQPPPALNLLADCPALNLPAGAFVTLYLNVELRGCIGQLEPAHPLAQIVAEMAVAAAFEDPRFPPLSLSELANIKIEISILSPLKQIFNVDEIEIGKHGVMVRQGNRSGVYLPQVATEEGWDRPTLLSSLCQDKAGLPANCWYDPKTEIFIFTSEVISE
jgi:AmmeMemoRadiSam system protein A